MDDWTPQLEVALFHSLHGHKPVGKISVLLCCYVDRELWWGY